MSALPDTAPPRAVYMVLSPHALPYARLALSSLFAKSLEPLRLALITDSTEDRQALEEVMASLPMRPAHGWSVHSENELAGVEAERFRHLPNLRRLRRGHPCWRKITDPLLLSAGGAEIILLDPDLYFPNPFTFESTPGSGLLLMWQQPNCLLPVQIVQRALDAKIPLARHVDIGVSHWRGGSQFDLEWLDWLVGALGGDSLPRAMHVEAILWSALAMRLGGSYLDPAHWVCWRRTQSKRVRVKLGRGGPAILASEPWERMKCFHAGGEAKWWLADALHAREQAARSQTLPGIVSKTEKAPVLPFVPLTGARYACEQSAKRVLKHLGYYRLFSPGAP